MKYLKLFEEYKVDNITEQDIIDTIEQNGKIKVSSIKDLPSHNKDEYIRPVDIDGDSIIVEVDGKQYVTKLKFVTTLEYSEIKESVITDEQREQILSSPDGFNTREDAEKELEWLEGKMSRLPQLVRLYRVVFIDEDGNYDSSKPGKHWTDEVIDEEHIDLIRQTMDSKGEPYIIIANYNKEDIDIPGTLSTNILYPQEYEIMIKSDSTTPVNYKLYKWSDIEKMDYKDRVNIWKQDL
jgi:hypothetical protein